MKFLNCFLIECSDFFKYIYIVIMRIEDSDNIEAELKVKATFYAGLISGAIYKAILHPIDTLKSKILVMQNLIFFFTF